MTLTQKGSPTETVVRSGPTWISGCDPCAKTAGEAKSSAMARTIEARFELADVLGGAVLRFSELEPSLPIIAHPSSGSRRKEGLLVLLERIENASRVLR